MLTRVVIYLCIAGNFQKRRKHGLPADHQNGPLNDARCGYAPTSRERNFGRIFSEKYFPASGDCMRSFQIFSGTAENRYTCPVVNSISRTFCATSYPADRRITDFTGCRSKDIPVF